jgi:uncharacterized RDD family membrane protein YckC
MITNDSRAPALPNHSGSDAMPQIARGQEAGFVSRLAAFVLDVVIVSMSSIVFAALSSLILSFFGFSARDLSLEAPARNSLAVLQIIIIALAALAVLLFIPAYFVLFWVLVGATPGQRILGLKVMRTGTQRLSWWRAIVRYVGYWVSALPLFLGFLWILVDTRRQGWHDKLADTIVVYIWPVAESEQVQHGSGNELRKE